MKKKHSELVGGGSLPAAAKSFHFWDLPADAAVRERPPEPGDVSSMVRVEFDRIVAGGASPSEGSEGDACFVTVGLDFGTSSTKVIVRLPYESGEPTVAVPAPSYCRSANHPYLWQTVLWVRESGEFIAYPDSDAYQIDTLKQGIVARDPNMPALRNIDIKIDVTRIEAAVAYLAYVIRHVRGWLRSKRPALFRGRRANWFVNLGLPAADYDNDPLVRIYRRAAAAALMLADSEEGIRIRTTKGFLQDGSVTRAADSREYAEELGVAVIPEIAAAAAAFAKSMESADELYLMVDVGAMTLDACTFRLNMSSESADRYSLLQADVRPLGVEAFHWFRSEGRSKVEFVQQCDRCLRAIVATTKRRRDPKASSFQEGNFLPLFLTGGGANNELHHEVITGLECWLAGHARSMGIRSKGVRLLDLPIPPTIDLAEPLEDTGRLAVAWGLSYPPTEIGRIVPPSDIEDVSKPVSVDHGSNYVSKDQV